MKQRLMFKMETKIIKANKNWKLLTSDMVLPFEIVDFLAKASRTIVGRFGI